jgi:hypothetical protein
MKKVEFLGDIMSKENDSPSSNYARSLEFLGKRFIRVPVSTGGAEALLPYEFLMFGGYGGSKRPQMERPICLSFLPGGWGLSIDRGKQIEENRP